MQEKCYISLHYASSISMSHRGEYKKRRERKFREMREEGRVVAKQR